MHFQEGFKGSDILEEAMKWDAQFGRHLKSGSCRPRNESDPARRLRIGFVSPDFNRHVVGRSIVPLLRELDRARCEIFCYSDGAFQDSVTERIRMTADHWRDLSGTSDEKAEEMICGDGIDVLIDLTAHMAHNRLRLFARKPAPVQATYLGYCSTTGLEVMDFRLSDPYLDSPSDDATLHECYRERTIRLPCTYWCYEPSGPTPEISELPALGNGLVTFACLNNFAKASPDAIAAWMEILQRTKESRLILHAPEGKTRIEIQGFAEERGIAPARLEFAGMKSWQEYMKTYERVDIGLDPYPYNGGITTLDALWMGVPVISLSGRLAVGRGGLSILSNAGLPELATRNRHDYVNTAVGLAEDLSRLRQLRETLREKMECSPLRDVKGFARDFEAVCRTMRQNRRGESA
jgi:predicted O-linked N-acetylglucosamine transferase (SPINDLY family)